MSSVSELVALRPPSRGLPRPVLPNLRGLSRAELRAFVADHIGGPSFRADQIFEWLHGRRVDGAAAMSNLPAAVRTELDARGGFQRLVVDECRTAIDGTRKLRLRGDEGVVLESVLIPNAGRGYTQCISSMIGCSLTCRFCATATLGFIRNLATWEIVDQVYQAQDLLVREAAETGLQWPARITNLVFMGMGEPLHNYGQVKRAIELLVDAKGAAIAPRRITVSSSGLVPAIERFAREGLAEQVGLAISLNATTDAVRDRIMPINTRWNIAALLDLVKRLPAHRRRQVTFEYVLLAGVNDSDDDAKRLVGLVGALDCHVNVIPFNAHPGTELRRPSPERVHAFVELARRGGLNVHVRTPRGDDIAAACGQLAVEAAS
ncbi:MAG: 23S rRNA (adenine(2503)-C(2))-methyltransferase RlmN [Deltaproteobacteria bacterium]|nr:23S rRNA (adenine(2503)-C(2))-methyltransferase RlmN [Nannocystaceae bacterium]